MISVPSLHDDPDRPRDWAMWLRSKLVARSRTSPAGELCKPHEHLLGPMEVISAQASLGEAVTAHRAAREKCEAARPYVSRR
jgi:hypothetical protein